MTSPTPGIELVLELCPPLADVATPEHPLHRAVQRTLAGELARMLSAFGLPGRFDVTLRGAEHDAEDGPPFRIRVNGVARRFSDDAVQRAESLLDGRPLQRARPREARAQWLRDLATSPSDATQVEVDEPREVPRLARFVLLLTLEALGNRPGRLASPGVVEALRERFAREDRSLADVDVGWLGAAVRAVLDLDVPLVDAAAVARHLRKSREASLDALDAAEVLACALRPRTVEIHLARDYSRALTLAAGGAAAVSADPKDGPFGLMRDGLFFELGIRFPDLRLVLEDAPGSREMWFVTGPLPTMPRIGLSPDEILLAVAPGASGPDDDVHSATNPATGALSVLRSRGEAFDAPGGPQRWDALGYLVLCLSVELRSRARHFVHADLIGEYLDQLGSGFPHLVEHAKREIPLHRLTRVVRDLVAEGVCVRNFPLILSALLDVDHVVTDPARLIVLDDRLPTAERPPVGWMERAETLVAFVRTRMKRQISHERTRGGATLEVLLVDAEIERLLAGAGAHERSSEADEAGAGLEDRVVGAVRAAIAALGERAGSACVLTTISARQPLRDAIAEAYPRLQVLAYDELAPELNIRPLGRITEG